MPWHIGKLFGALELFGLLKVENIGGKYISDFPIYCLARDI